MTSKEQSNKPIIIVGAGLCGTLLALRLAQRGCDIILIEKRKDMRKTNMSAGRSINLALSDRGLKGLALVGMEDSVSKLVIPMLGRNIHGSNGIESYVRYSGRSNEWINSISRGHLNILLLEEAEKTGKITVYFESEVLDCVMETNTITMASPTHGTVELQGSAIFGTDGSNSMIRQSMMAHSSKYRFDYSQQYLDTGYKELEIPASATGDFRLRQDALHIWPRSGFMMIALPNLDKSFTVTLFLPFEGKYSFSNLHTNEEIESFFTNHFATAAVHMPDLVSDFHANPTSSLHTVKCYPWHLGNATLLMGDAAHAVVPFYGQGMNASFEDVVVLDGIIEEMGMDWPLVMDVFQKRRKKDTDAIADLANDNFYEMRDATADEVFLRKRRIELQLEQTKSDYYSKYSMVTFREDIAYSEAMKLGRKQDKILMEYAAAIDDDGLIDLEDIYAKIRNDSH